MIELDVEMQFNKWLDSILDVEIQFYKQFNIYQMIDFDIKEMMMKYNSNGQYLHIILSLI